MGMETWTANVTMCYNSVGKKVHVTSCDYEENSAAVHAYVWFAEVYKIAHPPR